MMVKRAIYYGFNGSHAPAIPKAPRSVRRRVSLKKTVDDNKASVFELLAAVAGKLLQEGESSSASSNAAATIDHLASGREVTKQEQVIDGSLKTECIYQGSCERSSFVSRLASQAGNRRFNLKGSPNDERDSILECTSIITGSNCPGNITTDVNLKNCICKNESGNSSLKVVGDSHSHGESHDSNIENGLQRQAGVEEGETGGLSVANTYRTISALANSDINVKLPLCKHPIPDASFSRHRNDVKLGNNDNNEYSSRCYRPSTKIKAFRPATHVGDRRIRKLLTSKYWKVAPKLKDSEVPNADGGINPVYHKRKTYYSYGSHQSGTSFKRKKLFSQHSMLTAYGGSSVESCSNSPEKEKNGDKVGSTEIFPGASGGSSSVAGHQASFHSRDSRVKFSIKSFRVPELFIEVPETDTVGSLKRTVMEAVTAILRGGLHVGVVLRGKKILDDNITLLQTGISHNDSLDALGFTLEPIGTQTRPPLLPEDPPVLLQCDGPQVLTRSAATPISNTQFSEVSPDPPLINTSGNHVESNCSPLPSPSDVLTDKTMPDSKALVTVPPMIVEALAVVPINQKNRHSEFAQRRARRPFSVLEVEALVQAVEELGTGRWRDVKLRAFDNANHRTYVDLKDKWKTLVHTARISPQQRRGEPVPQELLDRVLLAHAYWSQRQDKQHSKHHAGTLKITEAQAEGIGV